VNPVELFDRSVATLVQSWVYLALGSPGAEVISAPGATVAAFVHPPDRKFLNNALIRRGAGGLEPTLDLIERVYADRDIGRYAVWVHESEQAATAAVKSRNYGYDSSTRSMAMPIADLAEVDTAMLDLVELTPAEFWRVDGQDGLLPELPADGAYLYASRFNGEIAATLMAFDHQGDCGIYMVGTVPAARRQGLATALSAHAVVEAAKRGCTTASLQSTAMAEGAYGRVGFHDLGRFDEYVPKFIIS
jgi:GNAT superfamily N-acetyltransferase